jgi:hypothetical protein
VDGGIAVSFLDLGARMGWLVSTTLRSLYHRERPDTYFTGGWVGPRAGLDVCQKSRPPPGFDPRTVQPIASSYIELTGVTDASEMYQHIKRPIIKEHCISVYFMHISISCALSSRLKKGYIGRSNTEIINIMIN